MKSDLHDRGVQYNRAFRREQCGQCVSTDDAAGSPGSTHRVGASSCPSRPKKELPCLPRTVEEHDAGRARSLLTPLWTPRAENAGLQRLVHRGVAEVVSIGASHWS